MITYKTGRDLREVYHFEELTKFDGIPIEGTRFATYLPISPFEFRQSDPFYKGKNVRLVELSHNDGTTDFLITDDWGEKHLLQIPNQMAHAISAAKEAILLNRISANFSSQ